MLSTTLATRRLEFAGPDTEGPHDGPEVGVDSAVDLQPDPDMIVRSVPRGHAVPWTPQYGSRRRPVRSPVAVDRNRAP